MASIIPTLYGVGRWGIVVAVVVEGRETADRKDGGEERVWLP